MEDPLYGRIIYPSTKSGGSNDIRRVITKVLYSTNPFANYIAKIAGIKIIAKTTSKLPT